MTFGKGVNAPMMDQIPGLKRGSDPTVPRQVVESKLKVIDRRRAEIEAALSHGADDSYKAQELEAERRALGDMRAECEAILNPKPKPTRPPQLEALYVRQRKADIQFLRTTIKQQVEQTEHAAEKEEAAGNYRAARLHRLTIPDLPLAICQEFSKDPGLLAELDGD